MEIYSTCVEWMNEYLNEIWNKVKSNLISIDLLVNEYNEKLSNNIDKIFLFNWKIFGDCYGYDIISKLIEIIKSIEFWF